MCISGVLCNMCRVRWEIIIIIIFNFYIALNTNVSKRFTNILLSRSLDSVLANTHCVHNLHFLGSISAGRYLTLTSCLTNNDGCILKYINMEYLNVLVKIISPFLAGFRHMDGERAGQGYNMGQGAV